MEQTKNETKIENKTESKPENKTAPGNDKPKKERKPLTEAQRLKRQKMIVLPAMVLVFIGAMWLIFAPSSGKEQEPGTSGYNIEMPDAEYYLIKSTRPCTSVNTCLAIEEDT